MHKGQQNQNPKPQTLNPKLNTGNAQQTTHWRKMRKDPRYIFFSDDTLEKDAQGPLCVCVCVCVCVCACVGVINVHPHC
jgi:hypothetical protein